MKIRSIIFGAAAGGCAAGMVLPPAATAAVSDEAFNTLSNLVNQQGQMLNELKKTHEQDQKQIQELREQLGQTQVLATNAVQQAQAAAAQPVFPAPNPATSATHNFMMVGDAEAQFGKTADQNATFQLADFAPIFLYRANDNILFEAGFDMMLNNGPRTDAGGSGGSSTSVSISFAQMDYAFNDYMTLVAGYMLLPLGTYIERGAGWLNKIPDNPLVDDNLLPNQGAGMQLRGAVPLGEAGQSMTYAIYADNGVSSTTPGSAYADNLDLAGNVGDTPNWHAGPSGGGRIGWFYPWGLHKDLELGVSGLSGEWSDSGNRQWSAAVLDAAVHLGPYFEAKGEYVNTWVETDNGNLNPNGWWVQASYKLAGLKLDWPVIRNLELVSRYDHMNDDGLFNGGTGGTINDRYTAGFVYYLSNTLLFEGDYEWMDNRGPNPLQLPPDLWVLQLSYGF